MILKLGTLALIIAISYQLFFTTNFTYFSKYFTKVENDKFPRCMNYPFLDNELENYKHLSILGHVFDVSSKPETYGLNGTYSFFTGKDGSRAFATGDFSEKGLVPDLTGLSDNEIGEIIRWLFFMNKNYKCVGHVPGLYFQMMGEYTDLMINLMNTWKILKERYDNEQKLFPMCSFETVSDKIKVSCPKREGQIQTYPRKLILSGTTKQRCTCLPKYYEDHRISTYDGCDFDSDSCSISNSNYP